MSKSSPSKSNRCRFEALLHSRRDARRLLGGCSSATLVRWEKRGVLRPLKPGGTPGSSVFYTDENIRQVAEAMGEASAD